MTVAIPRVMQHVLNLLLDWLPQPQWLSFGGVLLPRIPAKALIQSGLRRTIVWHIGAWPNAMDEERKTEKDDQ